RVEDVDGLAVHINRPHRDAVPLAALARLRQPPARQVRAGLPRPLPHPHHVATGTVDIGHHVAWGWRLHTRCAPQVVPVTGEPFHQTVDRSPATSLAGGLVDFALPLDHLPGAVGSLPLPDDVLAGSVLAH